VEGDAQATCPAALHGDEKWGEHRHRCSRLPECIFLSLLLAQSPLCRQTGLPVMGSASDIPVAMKLNTFENWGGNMRAQSWPLGGYLVHQPGCIDPEPANYTIHKCLTCSTLA